MPRFDTGPSTRIRGRVDRPIKAPNSRKIGQQRATGSNAALMPDMSGSAHYDDLRPNVTSRTTQGRR